MNTRRVILTLTPDADVGIVRAELVDRGFIVEQELGLARILIGQTTEADLEALRAHPQVQAVEADREVRPMRTSERG